ncbi:hypothetical protein TELCIR_02707 [Teladorsagia circumcincta]|uniref:Uncharacterized protein n=1 Tax=Teladorsagia circumcincta TaxID=45464 RepID=A0A2G9UYC4_TELCI|nr:hypothetical protein TELCIR_02707 [Teladorsagia circumcincta]
MYSSRMRWVLYTLRRSISIISISGVHSSTSRRIDLFAKDEKSLGWTDDRCTYQKWTGSRRKDASTNATDQLGLMDIIRFPLYSV